MAIPDFQTLMMPVLQSAAEKEVRISDVVENIAVLFGLLPEERSQMLPSGRQTTFANRVHWAKSYLGKARLIELTRRAHFKTTERGLTVLRSNPSRIDVRYLSQFPEFEKFRAAQGISDSINSIATAPDRQEISSEESISTKLTPDEIMRSAYKQLEASLASDLLERVLSGSPAFFESLVVRLLVAMGYGGASVSELDLALVVGGSGDNGVDGVINQDALGLDRIYVQAKRYAQGNNIGSGAIRDFFGSLDRFKATKGLFVTTSTFSNSARETADMLSKRIVLVDGVQLALLMIRNDVGCRMEEILTIKKLDEDFFDA